MFILFHPQTRGQSKKRVHRSSADTTETVEPAKRSRVEDNVPPVLTRVEVDLGGMAFDEDTRVQIFYVPGIENRVR